MNMLYTETFGCGPRLVLIHGWAMHSGVWREMAESLAVDFQVTCVDLPGHGRSPAWNEWTLADTAAALAELEMGPALWLGWSLGGQVVLELARCYPDQVSGLISLAANPHFVAEGEWPGMSPTVFKSFVEGVEIDAGKALNRFLALACRGAVDPKRCLRRLQSDWTQYPPPSLTTLRQGLAILRQADLRGDLNEIACPVAVVAGREDCLVPFAAAERLARGLPQSRLSVWDDTGHAPFLSQPERLVKLVRAFGL
ncbi:MAG: pimeloyl-ACP methyl ester esterase BioH [Methylothermaceae bacterium]|nr:pimeloyl-ACP methyl ester esterase BioH [Methylothermaceae bacterium]